MNKKIYSFAMMALLAFCGVTPLAAQESADFAAETAEETSAYYVDDNLAAKFASIFEIPDKDEISVIHKM